MAGHIITVGRQVGSGGREIGRKLSQALGYSYYDRELLTLAAERAEVNEELFAEKDEKAANPWLFKGFYTGGPKVPQGKSAEDVLFQMQSEVICELAEKEDCILIGRCADVILEQRHVDRLSLFICAPFDWRVQHRLWKKRTSSVKSITRTTPAVRGACRRTTTSASTAHGSASTAPQLCWPSIAASSSSRSEKNS